MNRSSIACIILQHLGLDIDDLIDDVKEIYDFSSNNKTINALNDIINYGKNNGYTFEAINDETPTIHHRVNN